MGLSRQGPIAAEAAPTGSGGRVVHASVAHFLDEAPWGFVDTGRQWALCTAGGERNPQVEALADWLQWQLAA